MTDLAVLKVITFENFATTLEQIIVLTLKFHIDSCDTVFLHKNSIKSSWSKVSAYTGWISPQLVNLPFSKILVVAQCAWSSWILDNPAKRIGVARALILGLYTLEEKEKISYVVLKHPYHQK